MAITLAIFLIAAYLLFMFLIVEWKKDNYVGNFTWGIGCVLIAIYTFFLKDIHLARHILITVLTIIWGIRLGVYFYSRYHRGMNPRFIAWQKEKGNSAQFISFMWIFIGQGLLMLIMALPIIVTNISTIAGLNWLDLFALLLWLVGFLFESVGDYQLYNFMKNLDHKGHIMNQGLWHYSRHPNYFGEIVMWWSIYFIALSVPYGAYTIIAPLTITFLLRYVTGIPENERPMANNPDYQKYKKTTDMLIPWKIIEKIIRWKKHEK